MSRKVSVLLLAAVLFDQDVPVFALDAPPTDSSRQETGTQRAAMGSSARSKVSRRITGQEQGYFLVSLSETPAGGKRSVKFCVVQGKADAINSVAVFLADPVAQQERIRRTWSYFGRFNTLEEAQDKLNRVESRYEIAAEDQEVRKANVAAMKFLRSNISLVGGSSPGLSAGGFNVAARGFGGRSGRACGPHG